VFGRFARGLSRRLHGEEDGLTLVETLVAVTVMLFTVLSLAYTGVVAFADIALARQRQDATALADRTMELVRALPFDRIKTGLQKADLDATSDPNIVKPCGGVAGTFCFRGEHIPSGTVGTLAPLAPHQSVHTVGPTTYTVSTYVTYYQDDQTTTPPTFRVVVIVSWNLTVRRGASNSVEVQSILTSPTGCLSTATHPFAAPCQPFFYADAVQDQGSIRITGSIDGVSLDHASLLGTADGSNMQIEQISAVQGRATTSGVDLQLTGQDPQSEGDLAVSSGADNDPSQPSADFQDSLLAPPQVGGTLTASDPSGSNSIDVTATSGDNARSISTTSSTTTNQCPPSPGTPQTDQLPCGSSTGEQGSAAPMTASTTLNGVSADLGPATLASLGPSETGSAFTDRDIPSGSDGTVHADVSRSTGTLSLADLPANAPRPSGWAGYLVQLSDFTDAATAVAGAGAGPPTVTKAGTLSVWNDAGYTSVPLTSAPDGTVTVKPVHLDFMSGALPVHIDIVPSFNGVEGQLGLGGTSTTTANNCGTSCTQNVATAGSPIVGDIQYTVTLVSEAITLCDLNIHVDMGSITAKAVYQQAPAS